MTPNDTRPAHGMHVTHDGPPDAPPLLLIHGSAASGLFWRPVVPALAEHHHVIRVDLPGCGRSPRPASFAVGEQAAAIADLLDDLALRGVAVAGHSSGGYVATALAEGRPDLVGSITLLSSGPALDALRPQHPLARALTGPPLGRLFWAVRGDGLIRKGITMTCHAPVDVPEDIIAEGRRLSYRTFRSVLRCNGAYLAERNLPERLRVLDVPVAVVFGAADPRWDPESARRYEAVPGARITWLPEVGHLPTYEAPERTAEALLDAVAGGSRAGS